MGDFDEMRDCLKRVWDRNHLESRLAQAEWALDALFDAHYGTEYHHCGDGDGLTPEEAALIVRLVRERRNKRVEEK